MYLTVPGVQNSLNKFKQHRILTSEVSQDIVLLLDKDILKQSDNTNVVFTVYRNDCGHPSVMRGTDFTASVKLCLKSTRKFCH